MRSMRVTRELGGDRERREQLSDHLPRDFAQHGVDHRRRLDPEIGHLERLGAFHEQRAAAGLDAFDIDLIRKDDADVYKMIARGDTLGVFQLESSGFREILKKLKPDCLEDIVAARACLDGPDAEYSLWDVPIFRPQSTHSNFTWGGRFPRSTARRPARPSGLS